MNTGKTNSFTRRAVSALALTALWAGSGRVSASEGEEAFSEVRRDVAYSAASERTALDLYYPIEATAAPKATHIYIHGGGWVNGSKSLGNGFSRKVFEGLSEAGFLGVSVGYRLVDEDKGLFIKDCATDCFDALRYLKLHHEELGIDLDRVYIWGSSAGAHLALLGANAPNATFPGLLASDIPSMDAVIAVYPPTDMPAYEDISVLKNGKLRDLSQRIGASSEEDPVVYSVISPLAHLTQDDPPALLIHGTNDLTVNIEHSYRYLAKSRSLEVPCELVEVPGGGHGGKLFAEGRRPSQDEVVSRMLRFLIAHAED
ncbi:alpha/beta hydrolase [Pelagicoccus sp. SDUM812005]|uniref:alpha/beta hydrolase n=1 Tax=Pelagicoccus sp. SDUM812005 TaxID=3041257 RepID=UPI00280ECEFA|nr:alpha/beta hydrolase [Pelagicoccus sp. SDUM812005]MDQ8181602.1 alpha/beta hydrolase [Pelagicoccus sp. SDUM812005]